MSEDTEPNPGGGPALSRREFTLGAGGFGALVFGGGSAYTALSGESADPPDTYIVRQGYLRWEVTPFDGGDRTVEEFYDYGDGSANPAADLVGETPGASRLFLYSGPVGTSLGFLHGGPGAESGGTAFLKFSGLKRSKGEWAVRDDPMDVDDDFEKWEGGNAKAKWEWDAGETDGGAFWGGFDREDFTVKVTPKALSGVDAWQFLRGTTDAVDRVELYPGEPVKIRPTAGGTRSVRRANVEIMPGTEDNEFDPYATERMTVALRSPPEGADGEWVDPADVDPGNYSVYFGSRSHLAGGNAAGAQKHFRRDGDLLFEFKTKAANFTLDSAYGFLTGKDDSGTWYMGRDAVRPGGFNNADADTPLVVTDLNYDPEGGDAQHLAAEYVQFTNDGGDALDLGGYTVSDEAGWEFVFPEGFTLDAGADVRLHTGDGEWTDEDVYWAVNAPVWDNDGDTVTVTDADGERVLEHAYPGR